MKLPINSPVLGQNQPNELETSPSLPGLLLISSDCWNSIKVDRVNKYQDKWLRFWTHLWKTATLVGPFTSIHITKFYFIIYYLAYWTDAFHDRLKAPLVFFHNVIVNTLTTWRFIEKALSPIKVILKTCASFLPHESLVGRGQHLVSWGQWCEPKRNNIKTNGPNENVCTVLLNPLLCLKYSLRKLTLSPCLKIKAPRMNDVTNIENIWGLMASITALLLCIVF